VESRRRNSEQDGFAQAKQQCDGRDRQARRGSKEGGILKRCECGQCRDVLTEGLLSLVVAVVGDWGELALCCVRPSHSVGVAGGRELTKLSYSVPCLP
jgi:hypothetical protein